MAPEQTSAAETVLVTSMMRALSVFRWVTLAWAAAGVALGRGDLTRPVWAVMLLLAALGMTLFLHVVGRRQPLRLLTWPLLAAEVGLGIALLIGDGLVFTTERSQSLPWAWPAAGIAAVGIASSGRAGSAVRRYAGLMVAVVIGLVSLSTEIVLLDRFAGPGQIGLAFSKIGLWLLVGLLVGPVMDRLLRAERLISVAKAREELARELHDGVLQTLAVVQRRSSDAELAALARDQENSLRTYLSDARLIEAAAGPLRTIGPQVALQGLADLDEVAGLDGGLRRVAADVERRHRIKADVVVASDCPALSPATLKSVLGAVGEAMTNSARHGKAERVTVFAEPADGQPPTETDEETAVADPPTGSWVFVSVHDNGQGFEVDEVTEGIGLSRSIKGRISDQGGRVAVTSRPGKGTEVKLWVRASDKS